MTVIDGALDGSGVDRIRMKIYNRNTGFVYYDNQPGAGDAEDPVTVVGSNSLITIQKNSTAPVAGMQIESQPSGNTMAGKFEITVFPNPSNQEFTLLARSNDQVTKLQVEVYDPQGRLVEKKGNINVGTTFKLGGWYKPGVYVVKIKQGENREVVKLVKL